MFGGVNDNTAAPADHQGMPQDSTMADAPSNGMTPGDAPMAGFDASSFPGSTDTASVVQPGTPAPTDDITPAATTTPAVSTPTDDLMASGSDDLINIKQQALQQLSPLVGHLDQTPEEKFRTTMMMIQASDNADLIKDAYAAAQQIPDEKVRAQALLDVINEINYFTQHQEQQQ